MLNTRRSSAWALKKRNAIRTTTLGRVGNAGASSEPHLHFGYLGLDRTGRYRNLPVRIEGLKSPDGRPAIGVPKGGLEYLSEPAG